MKTITLFLENPMPKNKILEKLVGYFSKSEIYNKSILIIIEDITRPTPINLFFGDLLGWLIKKNNKVTVLFAVGTHRPMTKNEMLRKLGVSENQLRGIKLLNHNATAQKDLIEICIIDNVALKINRLVQENNVIVCIGSVLPHRVMGFSGGAKFLCPGIANKEFIEHTHWKSNFFSEEEIMGVIKNPMRHLLDDIAEKIEEKFPIKYISINCVTVSSNIVHIAIGNFHESYLEAAEISKKVFFRKIPKSSNILTIVDDRCVDFWQAAKAIYNCGRAVKNGGSIVVRGRMKEGISKVHGEIIKEFGYRSPKEINKLIESGKLKDKLVASHMVRVGQYLEKIKIYLSSEYINPKTCKKINLGYVSPKNIDQNNFDYVVYNPVDIILEL